VLEHHDADLQDRTHERHLDHRDRHDQRHLSPRLIGAAVVAVVLVVFVLANTATTEISFVFATVAAPIWLMLTVVIVVGFSAGALAGSLRHR
jgi:uncharacterized integral membrane protein